MKGSPHTTADRPYNVRLTSLDHPQIEGKFITTPSGLTNLFYGFIDY